MKVVVDPERCRGHARCLAIAPDAFEFLDDEDRTIVHDEAAAQAGIATLRAAQVECPERAITIETGEDDSA
ncbi:ferredoxin [Frankia gtarii]|uniref:ferredoxin n=1 Tax=Frankia gtarii TaxID=2950102 RepID=UPI0021C1A06B|nr:ferredoxin [Frankia gtarii]